MASSSADAKVDIIENNEDAKKFVSIIKNYKILNEKSMLPERRKQRQIALREIKLKVANDLKIDMTESQIRKKVMNMKSRLKKKPDKNLTGNKKIEDLKDWEKDLLDFLEGESNPTIKKIEGKFIASYFVNLYKTNLKYMFKNSTTM